MHLQILFALIIGKCISCIKFLPQHDTDVALKKSISQCVLDIAIKEFKKNASLVLMTDFINSVTVEREDFSDLMAKVLNEHEFSILMLKSTQEETKGSWIPNNNAESVVIFLNGGDIKLQATAYVYKLDVIHKAWNPFARLVIISMSPPLGVSNLKWSTILMDVAMQKLMISDSIVLIPQSSWERVYVNIYSWIPAYQQPCKSRITRATLLHRWDSINRRFISDSHLFPRKEFMDMKGCELIVRVQTMVPHCSVEVELVDRNYRVTKIVGIMVTALEILAREKNFKPIYMASVRGRVMNIGFPVDILQLKHSPEYFKTFPYLHEGVAWTVPTPEPVPRWQVFVLIFSPTMWLFVTATYIFGSLMLWMLSKFSNSSVVASNDTISLAFLNALCTNLGTGFYVKNKNAVSVMFLSVWFFYCLQMNTAYQSALIKFLSDPGAPPPLKTISDLKESGLTLIHYTKSINSYSEHDLKLCCDHRDLCILNDCFSRMSTRRDIAMAGPRTLMKYFSMPYYNRDGKPAIALLEEDVFTQHLGMVFHRDPYAAERINVIFRRLTNAGIADKLTRDITNQLLKDLYPFIPSTDPFVLTLSHFQGAFFMLGFGLVAGSIVFLFERLQKFLK